MEVYEFLLLFFLIVLMAMFFCNLCLRLVELCGCFSRRTGSKRAYVVSEAAARVMFDQLKQAGVLVDDLPAEREEYAVTELCRYARRAVFVYTDQMPEPDRKETP